MLRPSLVFAGLLLPLSLASCDGEVNIGTSELESVGDGEAGEPGPDAGDGGTNQDAAGDELTRIAEEMAGTWTSSFGELELTLQLTHTAERGGTARLDCTRSGQECGDFDGGVSGFEFIRPGSKYWVVEASGPRITGVVTFNPLTGSAVVFTLDRVKNTLTLGPPLLLFVTTFTKDKSAGTSRTR